MNFSKLERETGRQTDRQTESTIQFLLVFIPEMGGGVANVIRQDQLQYGTHKSQLGLGGLI